MTDESLMLSVKNDDLDKAAILYERYKKKIYRYFLYRSDNDIAFSEDSTQQVFYRLIKYRKSYKKDSNFSMWIFGIARNIRILEHQKQAKMSIAYSSMEVNEAELPLRDERQAINQALDMLPELYREVLIMSRFLGMKYEEIAVINNCTAGVIKTRVFRATQKLKEVYFKIVEI